jgi:hypothetical protein
MNGTSGFGEVRSFTSRSTTNRLLQEQQSQFGTDFWHLLRNQNLISLSTSIRTKQENVSVRAQGSRLNNGSPFFTSFGRILLIGIVACLSINQTSQADDTISLKGLGAGEQAGVLVTEQQPDGSIQSHVLMDISSTGTVHGNFTDSPGAAIVFSDNHAPSAMTHSWTSGSDSLSLTLEPNYCFPLQVWIVSGDNVETQKKNAIEAKTTAGEIWRREKQGLCLIESAPIDVTNKRVGGQTLASKYGTMANCAQVKDIQQDAGSTDNAVNVYYFQMLNLGTEQTTVGESCGDTVILMGSETSHHLLAHELGHALSLIHTDGRPEFDTANVMAHASDDRKYLTEGQTFRAIVNENSIVNKFFNMRPHKTTHSPYCSEWDTTTDPICPAIQRRLWEDGKARVGGGEVWPPDECPSGNCP